MAAIITEQVIINEHNREFQQEDSDIQIRSSDNIVFKVHRAHLTAVSVVFRDMITIAKTQQEEICLTDNHMEDASTLANLLRFAYGRAIQKPTSRNHKPYQRLIDLSNKYDCPGLIEHLDALCYKWFNEGHFSPHSIFVMGYSLNRPALSVYALRNAGGWHWMERSCDTTEEEKAKSKDRTATIFGVVDCSTMDLTALDYEDFNKMPDNWKFPLLRATCHRIKDNEVGKSDWKQIAEDFEKLFKMVNKDHTS